MRFAWALIAALSSAGAVSACTSDELLSGNQPGGVKLDAGTPRRPDATTSPHDTGTTTDRDANVDTDAGARDATPRDTGFDPPDVGPACECPPLPSTCVPPAAGTPVFSKSSSAMQEQLLSAIACADTSLHAAWYEPTWTCIADALAAKLARDPDIVMQIIVDDDECPRVGTILGCDLSRIDGNPRVTIIDDNRSRYMHHKFMIADQNKVWVSSGNITRSSFCLENNDAIIIDRPEIVAGYEAEFQRMFTDREFGPIARTPISGGEYTLYFSPETPISSSPMWFEELVRAIGTASTSIDFMVFSLTRFEIGNALIDAHNRGVRVRGLIAPEYIDDPVAQALLGAQVPIRIAPVHSKVLIVDDARMATGSPNWTQNAWQNDEASLWIHSSTIAIQYRDEVARIFQGALPP